MATRFLNKKTHKFKCKKDGKDKTYWLTFGDEVNTLSGNAPSGDGFKRVEYRGKKGEWKEPPLSTKRSLEMYFLDVGQGDAAFVVTPNNTKILVDGGLRERALGFLIWKYRLHIEGNSVTIDHLFLSHADGDHVQGLIPLLKNSKIKVKNIYHNGIGVFDSGFDTPIGNLSEDERLLTIHNSLSDLDALDLADDRGDTFKDWIDAVKASKAKYKRLDSGSGTINIGDPDIKVEVLGPRLEPDGTSLKWFKNKSHTINGHSLVFRLTYNFVRTFFSGDLNEEGSDHLLETPGFAQQVNSHIFKAPHHGSHEYSQHLFNAVNPMITVVSSGEVPDHGHPRAKFLGAVGLAGRGEEPMLFSTALSALFVDAGEAEGEDEEATTPGAVRFSESDSFTVIHRRFKKLLPGIINIRTDGKKIYAFRRVQQSYQWESYGRIKPID